MATPDLEYHVQPLSTDKLGDPLHRFPAITVSVVNLRPDSVGSTHIVSRDLADAARDPPELPDSANATSRSRSRRSGRHVASWRRGAAAIPPRGAAARTRTCESDEDLVREAGNLGTTIFHPVGTCKMGNDERAVVGPDLRVHGIEACG